jgi:hypothetical protein
MVLARRQPAHPGVDAREAGRGDAALGRCIGYWRQQ